jgi:hypothetical protein
MSDSNRTQFTTRDALDSLSMLLDYVAEDRAESAATPAIVSTFRGHGMHLLLDVLLTDTWDMALIKVALATAEKRSDFKFDTSLMQKFGTGGWEQNRRRCRYFAHRLKHDEDHLDLLWLMLAACPTQPWTYGFVSRLDDVLTDMIDDLSAPEQTLRTKAIQRYEKWNWIHDGFPAIGEDPFAAVTFKQWTRAVTLDVERKREALAAASAAASSQKSALAGLREQPAAVEDAQDDVQPVPAGVTVIGGEPKLVAPYKALVGCATSLTMTPAVVGIRNVLQAEFPHATAAVDLMLGDLRPGEPLRFRPFVLVGEPGSGKSRLIRRLAELLGAKIRRYDAAASADNAFGGTPKRWSSAQACFPLTAIAETKAANVIVMIDELDKAASGFFNGSLHQAMMPFLERETAHCYPDVGLDVECNLSHVCYAATANDDAGLPKPLKDRVRIIRVPSPGRAQLELLCVSILKDLAVELNVPAAFLTPLAPDELTVIARAWGDNGSIRKLQKIVRGTVTARDQHASRH